MDRVSANRLLETLRDEPFLGHEVQELLGYGKSAAVYKATVGGDGRTVALKIYDPDLLDRYGAEVQEERLNRELSLVESSCPNVVQVFGGGPAEIGGRSTFYLAMEFIEGRDLSYWVTPDNRPEDRQIREWLKQLHEACDFLLKRELCHRDVKVDNIRIRENGQLVLLDLGVLKSVEGHNITDDERGRHFVGTLRYSPPELLHRVETDDLDGWTAVTIYQIGGVLYDLVQGDRLFGHINQPYADMVTAVDQLEPQILRSDIGQDLVMLAKRCLTKTPRERLSLVSWEFIKEVALSSPPEFLSGQAAIEKYFREASSRYREEIEEPERKLLDERMRTQESIGSATRILKTELELSEFGLPEPTILVEDLRRYRLISACYRRKLNARLPQSLSICALIPSAQIQPGVVVVSMLGIRGVNFIPKLKSFNEILAQLEADKLFETVWDDLMDEVVFRKAIRVSAEGFLKRYLEDTDKIYEASVVREHQFIEERRNHSERTCWIREEGPSTIFAFNSEKNMKVTPRRSRNRSRRR